MTDGGKLLLGVNIDHVATLRQARGTDYPDPLEAAEVCWQAGADGITMHLREDRRHIQDHDVARVKAWGRLPLNLEMANHPAILRLALKWVPEEVCLVPERREELTTEGGLDVSGHAAALRPTVKALQSAGILVSLFIDPRPDQIAAAAEVGATHIELHTGAYCGAPVAEREALLAELISGAEAAHAQGLIVNAGHGIYPDNLTGILRIPHLHALNIGHGLVARAVFLGLEGSLRETMALMAAYRGGVVQ